MPPFMLVSRDPKVLKLPLQGNHYSMVCWAPKVSEDELRALDELQSHPHVTQLIRHDMVERGKDNGETLTNMFNFMELLPIGDKYDAMHAHAAVAFNTYGILRPNIVTALARRWPNYHYPETLPHAHYDSEMWTLIAALCRSGSYVIDTDGLDYAELEGKKLISNYKGRAKIASPRYEALEGRVYQLPAPSFTILQGDSNERPCLHDWPHQPAPVRVNFIA